MFIPQGPVRSLSQSQSHDGTVKKSLEQQHIDRTKRSDALGSRRGLGRTSTSPVLSQHLVEKQSASNVVRASVHTVGAASGSTGTGAHNPSYNQSALKSTSGVNRPIYAQSRAQTASPTRMSTAGPMAFNKVKEPAHLPLDRRLLFPTLPPDKALPPIVLGHGEAIDQLNERLYHFIALTLRAYVLSWYPRFSKDRTLLPVISANIVCPVLSPILTGIHQDPTRVVDLILLAVPRLLLLHLRTYWQARSAVNSGFPIPLTESASESTQDSQSKDRPDDLLDQLRLSEAYHVRLPIHSVCPTTEAPIAPDPSQPYRAPIPIGQYTLSSDHLTAVADQLFRLHLPPKDFGCALEREMAKEIVGRLVLGSVGRKVGEGWFWWTLALKFLPPTNKRVAGEGSKMSKSDVRDRVEEAPEQNWLETSVHLIARMWTLFFSVWAGLTSLAARYSAAPPTQAKYQGCTVLWLAVGREMLGVDGHEGLLVRKWVVRVSWGIIEAVVTLLARHLDRLLPHLVLSALTPLLAFRLMDLLERILYPLDGYPGPAPPDLIPEEALEVRRLLEQSLRERIPCGIQRMLLPTETHIGLLLDPLDDPGCNAHLVGMILDATIIALEPKLAAISVGATK